MGHSWSRKCFFFRYAALAPLYYRGAAVAVIVYDITSPESFTKAQYWVKELQKHGSHEADLQDSQEVQAQKNLQVARHDIFYLSNVLWTSHQQYISKLAWQQCLEFYTNRRLTISFYLGRKLLSDFPVHPHLIHDCGLLKLLKY
ncbi:hypothetical protein EZV62_024921 [Acer yangbiense]|uniref:Uncharacterized protein n=1 Tax=Acer yangbiense TaxID=1000413 RepID=A0A5C7GYA2_9ROSI|nr:hypothetical protein EZV62_024921 [Acer yangbiense]